MHHESGVSLDGTTRIVLADGEAPVLQPGDPVRILDRSAVGHYRVPDYLRGRTGWVDAVIKPRGIENEEEDFGRNARRKRHYYRIAILMTNIWPRYEGSPTDGLRIEICETWLERI